MKRFYAFDLDGTLLNTDKELTDSTLDYLKKLQKERNEIVFVTGRSQEMVSRILSNLDFKCDYLLNNGTEYISANGLRHEIIGIDHGSLAQVAQILLENGFRVTCHSPHNKYIFVDSKQFYEHSLAVISEFTGMSEEEIRSNWFLNKQFLINDCIQVSTIGQIPETILKIDAQHVNKEVTKQVYQQLQEIKSLDTTLPHGPYFGDYLEIISSQSDKGQMVSKIAKEKGFDEESVVVFGDNANDICMLSRFKNSYAMKNAVDSAKQAATYVTKYTNDEEGVLHQLIEINESEGSSDGKKL